MSNKKSFKIARKPGQGNGTETPAITMPEPNTRARKTAPSVSVASNPSIGPTTRKTIEVPEDYFFRVKMRALERKMLEKELWSEILREYFKNHPTA